MTAPYPIVAIAGILIVALSLAAMLIWVERRLLALWQDRYGPNRVGPFRLLQVVADMIKIFTKEDWIPPFADKTVFVIAPMIVMVTVLLWLAVGCHSLRVSSSWISTSPCCFFWGCPRSACIASCWQDGHRTVNILSGGLRAAAQMISCSEVFMSLSLMGVVLLAGSFRLTAIVEATIAKLTDAGD